MQAQFHDPQFNFHFKCYFNCRRQPFDGSIQHCTLRLVLSTDSQPKSVMDHKEPKIMFLLFYHRLSTTSLARVRSERKHLSRSSSVQSVSVDSLGSVVPLVLLVPWFRTFDVPVIQLVPLVLLVKSTVSLSQCAYSAMCLNLVIVLVGNEFRLKCQKSG